MTSPESRIFRLEQAKLSEQSQRAVLVRQIPRVEQLRDAAQTLGNTPEVRRREAEIRLIKKGVSEHDRRIRNFETEIKLINSRQR